MQPITENISFWLYFIISSISSEDRSPSIFESRPDPEFAFFPEVSGVLSELSDSEMNLCFFFLDLFFFLDFFPLFFLSLFLGEISVSD